ncbi:MAG: amidohydrolase family protein [Schumannella sp.]
MLTMAGIHRVMLPGRGRMLTRSAALSRASATGRLADDFAGANLRERGRELVIASDAGVRFNSCSIGFYRPRCAADRGARITAVEAIGMATARPARALGLADVPATSPEGRQADAVLLDGLLTPESSELPDIVAVCVKGLQVV